MRCTYLWQPVRQLRTQLSRTYSNATAAINQAKPSLGQGREGPPATTGNSPVQSFSTPAPDKQAPSGIAPPTVVSSAPAGTVLKNINYFKNKTDPIAKEDHEYPAWLWTVLQPTQRQLSGEEEGNLYSKSKKERQTAAKRAAKLAALSEGAELDVPIDEQTIDLPFATKGLAQPHRVAAVGLQSHVVSGGAVIIGEETEITPGEAIRAQREVKMEKRRKNRAAIKEKNFLQAM